MKLQDYIHYYINCYGVLNGRDTQLIGVVADNYHFIDVETNQYGDGDLGNFKPVLRPLASMTRYEMKDIWQLIFIRPFHENGNIIWFDKEDRRSDKRWVMMSGVERVGIEMNGNVWADSDLSHHKFNPNIITHYLLKKHFDLFGLINAGLAIEAKPVVA